MNHVDTVDAVRSAATNLRNASRTALSLFNTLHGQGAHMALLEGFEAAIADAGEVGEVGTRKAIVTALGRVQSVSIGDEGQCIVKPARLTLVLLSKAGKTEKYKPVQYGRKYALVIKLVDTTQTFADKLAKLIEAAQRDADDSEYSDFLDAMESHLAVARPEAEPEAPAAE